MSMIQLMHNARRVSSAVGNKFVTVHRSFSADEQRDINSLLRKPEKTGSFNSLASQACGPLS